MPPEKSSLLHTNLSVPCCIDKLWFCCDDHMDAIMFCCGYASMLPNCAFSSVCFITAGWYCIPRITAKHYQINIFISHLLSSSIWTLNLSHKVLKWLSISNAVGKSMLKRCNFAPHSFGLLLLMSHNFIGSLTSAHHGGGFQIFAARFNGDKSTIGMGCHIHRQYL